MRKILFIDDLEGFASAVNVPLDGRPTIIIASADAMPLEMFKGEVSPDGVDEIGGAIERLLAE